MRARKTWRYIATIHDTVAGESFLLFALFTITYDSRAGLTVKVEDRKLVDRAKLWADRVVAA